MRNCPIVSTLMLTYNHAQYIAQAIESVLSQETEYPFELIVCDDASTDNTQDIIRRYAEKDERVILSLQQRNTKFGKNFADGCSLIRGKYVAFCEGDDYWTSPHKLQKQVSFLEQNPDFTVCAHRVQMLCMNGQPNTQPQFIYKDCTADEQRIKNGVFYADEAIDNYYFQTGSLVLRWIFSKGLPHWFRKRMMFDHFIFMLHAVEGKIKYFDEVMSIWRRHGGGYTWLQTEDKGLFFQKEGDDWISMYDRMDQFFSRRFTLQLRERILLALRSIASNCMETQNIDQLRDIILRYERFFQPVLKNAVLLDALRIAFPDRPEFIPPWETAQSVEDKDDRESLPEEDLPSSTSNVEILPGHALDDIPPSSESVWDYWTRGQEYARFFNLRSALLRWLWQNSVSTVWLPAYLPPILEDNRKGCQFIRKFYAVGNNFTPSVDFLDEVQPGEAVLTIAYLGRPLPESFYAALAARSDILWVEDRAQCLLPISDYQPHAVIYSPRKLFGVPDGGLLVGKGAAELEQWCLPPQFTTLNERQKILNERYECGARGDTGRQTLRWVKCDIEHQLSRDRMSRTTEAFLRRIPVRNIACKRQENWAALYSQLGEFCLWKTPWPEFAPYAFPLLLPQNFPAEILHTLLSRQNILCQRMWHPLQLPKNLFPLEEALAKRLLLLSCGQQYGHHEMERIATLSKEIIQKPSNFNGDGSFSVANGN